MLMAVGFSPLRAAAVVLLANTAPVAFGAIRTPIITAGTLTKIDYHEIGAYVGHQTPVVALFVPSCSCSWPTADAACARPGRRRGRRRHLRPRPVGLGHLVLGRADRHRRLARGPAGWPSPSCASGSPRGATPPRTLAEERQRSWSRRGGPSAPTGPMGTEPTVTSERDDAPYGVSAEELASRARALTPPGS